MMLMESLPRNKKVSVVTIAGPYRTGKSFLANRLLNQSKGFEIGSTTQACTKGIWIWSQPVEVSSDQIMLLLDTEGLASTERSTNVDIKIFTLSILLSSLFIFNQMGPITENSLEDLSLVANLTNYIHISQSSSKDTFQDYKAYFPHFFWVLRDFFHDLEGQTPNEYLEECLQPSPGLSQDAIKKNMIREAITKYFKERECFTMIRPVSDEYKLAHVDELNYDELKLEFRKQVTKFIKQVKRKLKPKIVNGKVLNSSMFLSLALEYTEAINNKETPTVLTAIDRVVQSEATRIQDENYDTFCLQLDTLIHEDNMPMDKDLFSKLVRKTIRRNRMNLQKQLAQIMNMQEIVKESDKFMDRIFDIISRKAQQNYSASYHYAIGLLTKLYETVDNPFTKGVQFDSIFIHDYIRKWVALCKEYKELGKCVNQWECFAESIVKMPNMEPLFINRELIEPNQEIVHSDLGEEQDEMSTQISHQHLPELSSQYHAFTLFESLIDQATEIMNEQLNKLKITLNETQSNERKLAYKRKQNDQMIELQRTQNEDITNAKHDLEVKIENLKREIQSRIQEIESLEQVKNREIKNLKKSQERQIKNLEEEIQLLENQKTQTEVVYQNTQNRVQDLDSEKRKEVSSIQNEIKKLEEDVEELKNKMKNKENNPHFIQVNQFFQEVKDYIEEFKNIFNAQETSKDQKAKLFNLQKQLNDIEYQANQNELQQKKQLDEKLRIKKEDLEKDLEQKHFEIDQEKGKIQMLNDKKHIYEQQIENINYQIQEAQEKQKTVKTTYENLSRGVSIKKSKVNELNKDIQEVDDCQRRIEEQIYMLSIENKQRQEDKEIIVMLLPQIIKAINGRSNNIKSFLNQFESDAIKSKVLKMFQTYKIPFK